MLDAVIATIGAAIVLVSGAITGLKLHRAIERYAPAIAAMVPSDVLVLAGFAMGAVVVAQWLL